ncbi:hypothetical protein CHS0354_029624 [Potamilus streckersoni]|uniref:Uncharacterized protein n=1 Tax=Potamilus streckersoni TaxID=2493646 RepID=A0AAE0RTL5_9BIVA|nr:hypothetical protein CHS0354_029624 [Potamilus streckersoni]
MHVIGSNNSRSNSRTQECVTVSIISPTFEDFKHKAEIGARKYYANTKRSYFGAEPRSENDKAKDEKSRDSMVNRAKIVQRGRLKKP